VSVAHWDEVEPAHRQVGHIGSSWRDLGSAAGTLTVGLQQLDVDRGKWTTPTHQHGAEEEIFYVLAGSGMSWQDGSVYEVGEGDCLVHVVDREVHSLRAGPGGLSVLAFGMRVPVEAAYLPRAKVAWLGRTWTTAGHIDHPFRIEAGVGEPEVGEPAARPSSIVNVADVEGQDFGKGETVQAVRRDLGRAGGSEKTGIKHITVAPGKLSCPPHCHSAEEELFVVLDGEGVVELGDEEHPVRAGNVVARPAGTKVAHTFRAGDSGLTLLAYGTRDPNDIAFYPRSNKVYFRGVGLIARIQTLDYWDGET